MKRLLIATSIVALATASAALAQNNPASSPTTTTSPTLTGGPNTGGRYQTGEGASGDLNSGPDKTSAARSMNAPHESMNSAQRPTASNGKHVASRVRQAQIALKQKGLYDGPIDGREGPKTRTALTQFQKQNGLQQSAQLNRRTLNALEAGSSSSSSAAPAGASQQ